jgi:TRAP-type C4-dicarboxylate transport system substrate-binding protein
MHVRWRSSPVDPGRARCVNLPRMSITSLCARYGRRVTCVITLAASAFAASPLQAQDGNAGVQELRLSTALAPTYPLGRAGQRWAQLVNEKAGAAFEVRQYPGATLAARDPGREFGALKSGLAELAVGSALAWSGQFAPVGVYAIPWLTGNAREQEALAADAPLRESVFAQMAAAGVIGLAVAPLGEHVLATTRAPIETPADLKGLRVRVVSLRSLIEVYVALGALPESMNFALAQAALAAGTLAGQDALPTTLVATRASASGMKFITRWGAFADAMVFAVRKASWDAWPEERRVLVRGAAEQAAREANALALEEAALAQLTRDGVTILRLSPTQRNAFRDAAQPAINAWIDLVGAELAGSAQAAVAAARK